MRNHYFQFKQFTVYQDHCAMKVCTDSCLFGAYTAQLVARDKMPVKDCLDIGAGTGLLSLMLAQKLKGIFDAVEIDAAAYQQAKENFGASAWKERLTIFNTDILRFDSGKKYDCIISNPPFFEIDLKSTDPNKNAAKHDATLTLRGLLELVKNYLQDDGLFAVLLPYHRVKHCTDEALIQNLQLSKKILVKQTPKHDYFRGMLFFSRNSTTVDTEEIIIKNEKGEYSEAFSLLLKDYYLYL